MEWTSGRTIHPPLPLIPGFATGNEDAEVTYAVEASEKWAGQTISQFSETTSGVNHGFEGGKEKFASGV